ncbi:MAG: hypothetical protein J0L59_02510 [Xanthomonadales bacterium]|nr:hypothetical protein [Xanthomonadales bacterium]
MSFDDAFAAEALVDLYQEFGIDATVQRGAAAPQPARIIVNYGQEVYGEHGQVVGRVTEVRFQCAQWMPGQGDVVAWTDRFGDHAKPVESAARGDDGLEAMAVLHG